MIEVYRTNVSNHAQATMLVLKIEKEFINYKANFDLHDCDNILRIKSTAGYIESGFVINLLSEFGFHAEILPDEVIVADKIQKQYLNMN